MIQSPHGIRYTAHRPVVMGRRGMVCSGNPLASQAGITILQKGGNAIDASIAIASTLNVVEPLMSGIGGDGFILIYNKADNELKGVNGTGAAPYAASRDIYLESGIPLKGILSVSVPGLLKAWTEAHQRYGLLNLSDVLETAIDLAENGFPVSHTVSASITGDELLREFPTSRAIFTRDGTPLQPGEMLYQRDLADTFCKIARNGSDTFYIGEIGRSIVRFSQQNGGLLTMKDLKDFSVRWEDPIHTTYKGYTVYEAPPNSSGHILLQELNLVELFDLPSLGCNTAESIHLMVEAKKLAFSDREAYLADPDFVDVPIPGLLSKEYAKARASSIDLEQAASNVVAGSPWHYQTSQSAIRPNPISDVSAPKEDTTCFTVVDQWGNAVSQLQSLQSAFGSSIVAGNTGILLNNRMSYWHLDETHVDCLKPGKRVRHTMNPVMVFLESNGTRDLVLVCGTPGADTQVQTNLQVITHVLDFGMTVAEAVEAPRWRHLQNHTESTYPHTSPDELWLEGRFPLKVRENLKNMGHQLNILGDWEAMGSQMMIQSNSAEGALHGGADPRRDGYAIGW